LRLMTNSNCENVVVLTTDEAEVHIPLGRDTSMERLPKLRPVFDKTSGKGNSPRATARS
jgi:hypothetical protein